MKKPARIILPIGILAIAAGIYAVLILTKKEPNLDPSPPRPVLVEVIEARAGRELLVVRTQGSVEPLSQTVLIPEVSGSIVRTSDSFKAGGFFEKGDVLIEIDPSNYESAVAQSRFNLEQAKLRLEQEQARADQALKEWKTLGEGDPPALAAREPQVRAEEANVAWARQALDRALRDLEKTSIRAPYAGMVREQTGDIGQYVAPGTQLGVIFSTESAEVRLPLSLDEVGFLDLPRLFQTGNPEFTGPKVELSARIGGVPHSWSGRIVRTEGIVDPTNRMVYAVARIDDPYGRQSDGKHAPLQIGLFVDAAIEGRTVEDVVVLPRRVLRGNNRVMIVTEDRKLKSREVNVLRADSTSVIISDGLEPGDLVSTTALDFVVEDMAVEIHESEPAAEKEAIVDAEAGRKESSL